MTTGPKRRFTPEEDAIITADYAAFVHVRDTAAKINHTEGTVRQRILRLDLHRTNRVLQAMRYAPDHLKTVLSTHGPEEFVNQAITWRAQQAQKLAQESVEHQTLVQDELAKRLLAIDLDRSLPRNEKMVAKRLAGATLEQIGQQHNLTRERVRQLTSPEYITNKAYRLPHIAAKVTVFNNGAESLDKLDKKRTKILDEQLHILMTLWHKAHAKTRERFLQAINEGAKP